MVRHFEDLRVWKQAHEMCLSNYKLVASCRDYGIKDQIQRAAVSVSANIAEGFSRGTAKEFVRFLNISLASSSELKALLYLVRDLNLAQQVDIEACFAQIDSTRAMLVRLIISLKSKIDG